MIHLLFLKKGELNMDTPQQLLHNFQDIISDDTTGLANLIVAIKGLNTYFEQAKRKMLIKLIKSLHQLLWE